MFSWTPENKSKLLALRADGNSMEACAKELNCAISTVSNKINQKHKSQLEVKAKPTPPKRPTVVLPRKLNSVAPIHKKINPQQRAAPQPTKDELYFLLAAAWRNTVELSHREASA
jgi:hypothetical protein